ncbi:MAG TPA: lytic transglycosylase domain-containing protein [Pyrinomonadaceae bacterium]|nr:lytic transglycosylase domain-containing protein [Pyrinomonadaceae bacterium]
MNEAAPIITLLAASAAVALGARLARRAGLAEATGACLTLAALALVVALTPEPFVRLLRGGDAGDYVLTVARSAGAAGLLFLAGVRFDPRGASAERRAAFAVAAVKLVFFAAAAALLATLGGQRAGVAALAASAVAVTSPWLAAERERARGGETTNSVSLAAVVLAALALLTAHLVTVLSALGGRATAAAYSVVIAYELVKTFVVIGFGYFVTTRFLALAGGRVPGARRTIGYGIISVLLFVLAATSLGQLGALAWAFVAGAVWGRTDAGGGFAVKERPAASALLLSLALLPLLLQAHGRAVSNPAALVAAVAAAVALKFVLAWGGARMGGGDAGKGAARRLAAASLPPAELSAALLGAAVTAWDVGGEVYYGVLAFAFVSMLAVPLAALKSEPKAGEEKAGAGGCCGGGRKTTSPKGSGSKFSRSASGGAVLALAAIALFASTNARAQSPSDATDDPVARAMRRIEETVGPRAEAAERVKAGSVALDGAVAARKGGDPKKAHELLAEAERLAAAEQQAERGALIDELYNSIAAERDGLNPRKAAAAPGAANISGLPGGYARAAVPANAVAAVNSYRNTLGRILEEERVPADLLAVAYVESRFNPKAFSPVGAGGIWQFMPGTAARYGLQVTAMVDHRTHPEHSTRAAARYLRFLYGMFGDWKLALAGYNWGEGNVQKAIRRGGTRDFDELARRGLIPLETRKYVPAVLALAAKAGGGSSPLNRRAGE